MNTVKPWKVVGPGDLVVHVLTELCCTFRFLMVSLKCCADLGPRSQ